jgi:transposase
MDHIGIDLGGRDSQVCVRNGAGAITVEARRPTMELGRWLATRAPARVVLETCTEAFRLAGAAQRHGHEVRVVAATLVRALCVSAAFEMTRSSDKPCSRILLAAHRGCRRP